MEENKPKWNLTEKRVLIIAISIFVVIGLLIYYAISYDYYKTEVDSLNAKITKLEEQKELISKDRLEIKEEKEKLEEKIDSLNKKISELEEANKKTTTTKKKTTKKKTKSVTVYVTNTGSKYHKSWCSYLNQSKIPISLKNAKAQGYTACSRCY